MEILSRDETTKDYIYEEDNSFQEIIDVSNKTTRHYVNQIEEYNKLLCSFEDRKEMLYKTIHGMTQLGYNFQTVVFFLGSDWKKELTYLPEDEVLSSYEDWYFVLSFKDDGYSYIDYEFYEKIKKSSELHKLLNQLGREGVVGEIELCGSYAEVQFIGPYFMEHEPANFKYKYEDNECQQLTTPWYDEQLEIMKGFEIDDKWIFDMSEFSNCRRR